MGMTVAEIKQMVMFQTNNDSDDLGDFMPHLLHYINEGYEILLKATGKPGICEAQPFLTTDTMSPDLPGWMHRAIADYATWLVYRNGNPSKQQRGYAFRSAFEDVRLRVLDGEPGKVRHFINIPS
jgi:hypothetical protein